jgi:hypothetical protein
MPHATPAAVSSVVGRVQMDPDEPVRYRSARPDRLRPPPRTLLRTPLMRKSGFIVSSLGMQNSECRIQYERDSTTVVFCTFCILHFAF